MWRVLPGEEPLTILWLHPCRKILTGTEAVPHDGNFFDRPLVRLHHAVHCLLGRLEALPRLLLVQLLKPAVAHQ